MSEHLDDLEALLGERPSELLPIAGAANSRVFRAQLIPERLPFSRWKSV